MSRINTVRGSIEYDELFQRVPTVVHYASVLRGDTGPQHICLMASMIQEYMQCCPRSELHVRPTRQSCSVSDVLLVTQPQPHLLIFGSEVHDVHRRSLETCFSTTALISWKRTQPWCASCCLWILIKNELSIVFLNVVTLYDLLQGFRSQ